VYRLATWRNRSGVVMPQSTIDKAPSAELKPDQRDSDSLPLYDVLDQILERYVEQLQKSSRARTRAALRKRLKGHVLPALEAYVTALQQLRPKHQKLRQIHSALTTAYTHWWGQLQAFEEGLTSDAAWIVHAARLAPQLAAIERAEQRYQADIKQYARLPRRRR